MGLQNPNIIEHQSANDISIGPHRVVGDGQTLCDTSPVSINLVGWPGFWPLILGGPVCLVHQTPTDTCVNPKDKQCHV